jgi:hypothetical protein
MINIKEHSAKGWKTEDDGKGKKMFLVFGGALKRTITFVLNTRS